MAMIAVACKLPNGLHLDLKDSTGGLVRRVTLRGTAYAQEKGPPGPIPGGYMITQVDEDFWNEWYKRHQSMEIITKKLVFANSRSDRTRDQAVEQEEIRSGMERLDPDKPGSGLEKVGIGPL